MAHKRQEAIRRLKRAAEYRRKTLRNPHRVLSYDEASNRLMGRRLASSMRGLEAN